MAPTSRPSTSGWSDGPKTGLLSAGPAGHQSPHIDRAFKGETPQARHEAQRQLGAMFGMFSLMAGATGKRLRLADTRLA